MVCKQGFFDVLSKHIIHDMEFATGLLFVWLCFAVGSLLRNQEKAKKEFEAYMQEPRMVTVNVGDVYSTTFDSNDPVASRSAMAAVKVYVSYYPAEKVSVNYH
jgi:hypothetical protein